jgi:hypothetical protein
LGVSSANQKKTLTDIHAPSEISTHNSIVFESELMPVLGPFGHVIGVIE